MEWKGRRKSANVEDKRGQRKGGLAIGGGIGGLVIILLLTLFGGGGLGDIMNMSQIGTEVNTAPYEETADEKVLADFVSVVLADTEDVWSEIFHEQGLVYEKPKLVLFTDSVQSACGSASSTVGPFYCPGDHKLYIDLGFFKELQDRFQAPGDFAMAYVIAHEVGHHVQTLLEANAEVNALRSQLSEKEFNQVSVKLELQADYFAGVWAHHEQDMNVLDEGDIEEAMNAASAIGDDAIQLQTRGVVVPDSFTHGTSEQRKRWFVKGFNNGTIEGGDTFSAVEL